MVLEFSSPYGDAADDAGKLPYRPAVIAPPHPLYGGRMDNPVVTTLGRVLHQCGYAPLLFNWSGVGQSRGAPSGRIEDAEQDYRAALRKALERDEKARVLAAGYSFGAVAALRLAEDEELRIAELVLVAPPLQMIESLDIASIERPIQVLIGDADHYAPVEALGEVFGIARDVRIDVIANADHFFAFPPALTKLGDLVRAAHS